MDIGESRMTTPRYPPPHGLSLPIQCVRVIDGDTIEAMLPSGRSCILRIDGYDAPERNTARGVLATEALERLLDSRELTLWISWPKDTDKNGKLDLDEILKHLLVIGERLRGTLWSGSCRVDEWMTQRGHKK